MSTTKTKSIQQDQKDNRQQQQKHQQQKTRQTGSKKQGTSVQFHEQELPETRMFR